MKRKRDGPDDCLRLGLDPHNLDEEWVSHPDKMQEVGEMVAVANDRVDRAKSKLELVKAQVELKVRKRPAAFGIDKITETSVAAAVVCSDDYQEAVSAYNRAKLRAGELKAAYEARRDCRPALENLVKLHLAGYHSDPKGPAGAGHTEAMRMVSRDIDEPLPRLKKRKKRGRPT